MAVSLRKKTRNKLTPRQTEIVEKYIEVGGNQHEVARQLSIPQPNVHVTLARAIDNGFDLEAFQDEQNKSFIQKGWRIVDKCSDILETKLDQLTDLDKIDKVDASTLSRVIYDLRRAMQGSVNYIALFQQRAVETVVTPKDIEQEAIRYLIDKYNPTLSEKSCIARISCFLHTCSSEQE